MMKSVVSEKAYIGIFVEKGFNYGAFFLEMISCLRPIESSETKRPAKQ